MKMHGLGNDFVVIDARGRRPVTAALARALGDRHRGIGFDQLAVIEARREADVTVCLLERRRLALRRLRQRHALHRAPPDARAGRRS
jgi:hypothetical protein